MADKQTKLSALDAAERALAQAGKPLHVGEITRRIIEGGLWRTSGKTPEATMGAQLAVDIKIHGTSSRFQRTRRGEFALRVWGLPEYVTSLEQANTYARQAYASRPTQLTLKDAAEVVLERYAGKRPMHYQNIAQKALELGLIGTTPEYAASNLLMQVLTDIARSTQRGNVSPFTHPAKGLIGLSKWSDDEPAEH